MIPATYAQAPSPLPPGPGRDLVTVACSQCHGLGAIVNLRDGAAGWKETTQIMIMRGAPLTLEESDVVVRYLSAHFGPGAGLMPSGPGSAVSLPDGTGKPLVVSRCMLCHDLSRVVAVRRTKQSWDLVVRNMVARGTPATAEEIETISSYLAAQFGPRAE